MSLTQKVGVLLLLMGLIVGLMGYLNQHKGLYLGECPGDLLQDFYANVSAELGSLAVTLLIIDEIYRRVNIEREKKDLVLQMGSPDMAFAREAVRKLRAQNWLTDGTLRNASLHAANLREVDLQGATLSGADLTRAYLWRADLSRAELSVANLREADLHYANLREADLRGANLREAALFGAKFSDYTTLPDGTKWTPDTDMARFTDPKHPDFWSPDA